MKNDTLTTAQIPPIIESYFRASNDDDIDALVDCFSPDARVADERETHSGRAGIKAWAIDVRKKYEFKIEVLHAARAEEITTVTAKVFGNFPGSPVNLDFKFTLDGKKIKSLEIA